MFHFIVRDNNSFLNEEVANTKLNHNKNSFEIDNLRFLNDLKYLATFPQSNIQERRLQRVDREGTWF